MKLGLTGCLPVLLLLRETVQNVSEASPPHAVYHPYAVASGNYSSLIICVFPPGWNIASSDSKARANAFLLPSVRPIEEAVPRARDMFLLRYAAYGVLTYYHHFARQHMLSPEKANPNCGRVRLVRKAPIRPRV